MNLFIKILLKKKMQRQKISKKLRNCHNHLCECTRVETFTKRYDDFVTYIALITNDGEPIIYYQETMKVYESAKWKLTMKEEMGAL